MLSGLVLNNFGTGSYLSRHDDPAAFADDNAGQANAVARIVDCARRLSNKLTPSCSFKYLIDISPVALTEMAQRQLTADEELVLHKALRRSIRVIASGRLK